MAADELAKPQWREAKPDVVGWSFHHELGRAWMRADPAAAIASLDDKDHKAEKMSAGITEMWAEMDFNAAWSHFFPDADAKMVMKSENGGALLARGLLAGSPVAMDLLRLLRRDDSTEEGSTFGIAGVMIDIDPRAALEWAKILPVEDPLRSQIMAGAARSFASSDPEKALVMLRESGGVGHEWDRKGAIREIFAALAAGDSAGTAARVGLLPEDERTSAISGYLTHTFMVDPAEAAERCRSWLADPALRKNLMEGWAQSFSWGHGAGIRHPAGMLEAIPELNDAVDDNVLSTWAKGDPEAAAGWIGRRLEAGEKVPLGDEGILAEIAISKPEFMAAWLTELPQGALLRHGGFVPKESGWEHKSAAETLTANWGAFDPAAAREWTESLPAGELRSAAEAGLKRTGKPNPKPW